MQRISTVMIHNFKYIKYILIYIFLLQITFAATGQNKSHFMGTKVEFLKTLDNTAGQNARLSAQSVLTLSLSNVEEIQVQIKQFKYQTSQLYTGEVTFPFKGQLSFIEDANEGLSGHIYSLKEKIGYIIRVDASNKVYLDETDVDNIICIDYDNAPHADEVADTTVVAEALDDTPSAYLLQSLPGAGAVAYLDFDGEVVSGTSWVNGSTINAPRTPFTEAEMKTIWKLVSEDFMPFRINITTNRAVYNAAPRGRRTQCIFTTNDAAADGAGGVAYLRSFRSTAAVANPCWVFIPRGAKSAGEAATHEIGHTLGLSHDGRTSPSESYYAGQGNWAPIMGVGYSRQLTHWSIGEYANSNNREDDIAVIAATNNGFGFKLDEHSNTTTNATAISFETDGTILALKNEGIITSRTDLDVFRFTTTGGACTLNIRPAATYPNLDISIRVLNATGGLVATATRTGAFLDASFTQTLAAGTYFIEVNGIGDGTITTTGYSDYSSLGFFNISGKIPVGVVGPNATPQVAITGPAATASFTAPATVGLTATASDPDGSITRVEFFNGTVKLGEDITAPYTLSWTNVPAGTYSITAKATDNSLAVVTSTALVVTVRQAAANRLPVVIITSPVDSIDYRAVASLTIRATASDADGTVSKVEFYRGRVLLYTDNTSPYSYLWTNVVAGEYDITAVAYDNLNGTTISDTVTVVVINDRDRDGISDETDNCVTVANVSQEDTDNDGIGNACDIVNAVTNSDQSYLAKIAPNPFTNTTTITIADNEVFNLSLFSMEGIELLHTTAQGTYDLTMALPSGAYLVRIGNSHSVFHKLIVKE